MYVSLNISIFILLQVWQEKIDLNKWSKTGYKKILKTKRHDFPDLKDNWSSVQWWGWKMALPHQKKKNKAEWQHLLKLNIHPLLGIYLREREMHVYIKMWVFMAALFKITKNTETTQMHINLRIYKQNFYIH